MATSKLNFTDENVVILGTGDLGRAVAIEALAAGARVFAVDIKPLEGLEGIAVRQVDLTDFDAIEAFRAELEKTTGPIHLVCSTIYQPPASRNTPLWKLPKAMMQEFLDVGIGTYIRPLHDLIPLLLERGGNVVLFISINAYLTNFGNEMYASVKAFQWQLTRALALSLEKEGKGNRVNCVSPGAVQSSINEGPVAKAAQPGLMYGSLDGRIATPPEIARHVLWLLTDAAAQINGAMLPIGGSPHLAHSYGVADHVVSAMP